MREKYEIQLAQLNSSVLSMGKMIEVAIESTILALMGRDIEAAKTVHANDENIDNMEREIESLCMRLLLQQQPMATDLRFITAALKMITDMERIGDHAVDIADLVLNLSDLKYSGMSEISEMSSEIIGMIHDSIQSYIERDYNKAKDVIARDDLVDNLYHIIKKDLIEKIKKTEEGEQILDYFLIAKYFERIGDHAVNIAERVVFALTGKKE
ncbi:MAG: phosphate signaling complex protein PhoU [Treponema sp.]|nr:phosphate signaling complex protein PhoU [Treponema sp.]